MPYRNRSLNGIVLRLGYHRYLRAARLSSLLRRREGEREEMRTIELTQGKVALVDDELFDALNAFKWCAHRNKKRFYAVRTVKGKTIRMHWEVFRLLGLPKPASIDHRDHDGLNNQRDNLRPANISQQNRNQEQQSRNDGFIGVSLHKLTGKWRARAKGNEREKHLGLFDTALEAALARDEYVLEQHGEFAVLNFPEVFRGRVKGRGSISRA